MTVDEERNGNVKPLAGIDRVIHGPSRLLILAHLYVIESADFLFPEPQIGLARGNPSSHLTKLEAAGYLKIVKKFVGKIPRTLLSLTAGGRQAFRTCGRHMKQVLDELPE